MLKFTVYCLVAIFIWQNVWASSIVKYEKRQSTPQHSSVNSISVQCFISATKIKQSRAVILQVPKSNSAHADRDIAITTGHGLIDKQGKVFKNCEIIGPSGQTYRVNVIKLAPGYKPGTQSDWAVISFVKLPEQSVIRYKVVNDISEQTLEQLSQRNIPVLFSTARALPQNGQNCNLYPQRYAGLTKVQHKGLLPHTCRAIPGQSGSPVSIIHDGHPILLGIHMGNVFVLQVPGIEQSPRFYGYMRVIDATMLETLTNMLRELEE